MIFPSLLALTAVSAVLTSSVVFWLVFSYLSVVLCCRKKWRLVAVGFFCGFLCLLRLSSYDAVPESFHAYKEGDKVTLKVTLWGDTIQINGDRVSFDAVTDDNQKLRISLYLEQQKAQEQWRKLRTHSVKLMLTGKWSYGAGKRNLHGFSYREYLENNGYRGSVTGASLKRIEPVKGTSLFDGFFAVVRRLRGWLIDHVEEQFYPVTASYIKALLFGFKDPEFQLAAAGFKKTGILHLFSISGMHLLFFFGLLDKGFRRIRLTKAEAYLPMCLCLVSGWLLFGAGSSVSRACLMYFVTRTMQLAKLSLSPMDRFAVVLLILQLIWPRFLLTTGGQLSLFMSWLIILLPQAVTWKEQLLQGIKLTLLPAPLLMYLFFEWSWVGGLLTVCCLPLFGTVLLPGFLLLTIFSVVGLPVSLVLQRLLESFLILTGQLLQKSSFSSLITGKPVFWLVLFCLLAGMLLVQKRAGRLWQLATVCFLLPYLSGSFPISKMVAFVDVGQGDSAVLKERFNRQVTVIDTGGRLTFSKENWAQGTSKAAAEYSLIPFLKGEGVWRIHQLILTHGDSDHMGDAAALFDHFKIDELIIGAGASVHPNLSRLLKMIPAETKVTEAVAGDVLNPAMMLQVLAPTGPGKGENEDSLVVTAKVGSQRYLFTGDLDQAGERQLVKRFPELKIDILKVGHHGSRTSSDPGFLGRIQPCEAVISAGFENRFGHPHQEVLETLAKNNCRIWRTDLQGMIYYDYPLGTDYAVAEFLIKPDGKQGGIAELEMK